VKKRGVLVFCLLSPLWAAPLWAQSNAVMDSLLSQKQASFGDAVYMVMSAVKLVPDSASPDDAIKSLKGAAWGIKILGAGSPITLGEYAFLLMRAFKMHGGIMYGLFPGPRYAARELAYDRLIYGDASPYRTLSGREVVELLGSVMRYEESRS